MASPTPVKKISKKAFWIIGIIMICIFGLLFLSGILILNKSNIFPNVYVESVKVGGLTPQEAKATIKEIFDKEIEAFHLELTYEEQSWNLSYEDLGLYYVYDDYISKAYGVGRSGNYFERIKEIYGLRKNPRVIKLEPYYDHNKMDGLVEELSQIVNKPAIDAKIERKNGKFLITKEVLGVEVDKNILKEKIIDAVRNFTHSPIVIPVTNPKPDIMEEDLMMIEDLMGEYRTTFNKDVKGRAENIRLAVKSINGTLLMPGEEFSFNESTGPRSVEEGYKEAPVIVNGELVPGIGGGICQVSTTLYQAALRSDVEITARRNHGLPVGYVPLGYDATVAYDYIDFKFKNNKEYPIYIESFIEGNQVFVKIYGKKTNNILIDLESEVIEVVEPKIQIKKDDNMYLGERKISKEPKKGYRVVTHKIYIQEGKEIKREIISKDFYPPRDGIIIEGTRE